MAKNNQMKHGVRPRNSNFNKPDNEPVLLYGFHTVVAALNNPKRNRHKLYATSNARRRLEEKGISIDVPIEECTPRTIGKIVPRDAVHQGAVLSANPLKHSDLEDIVDSNLILALDQITDPHNVGAIMRTAVTMGVDSLVTTSHHSPSESSVLAKSASGALDMITHVQVKNLARFATEIGIHNFQRIALDSDAEKSIESIECSERMVIILGSEGKGVRPGVRNCCDLTVRLDLPGKIKSLNVSNAAAVALYAIRKKG